ncbi:MAG: DUF3467 domain-containing protein [Anaerolineae bacterium]|nr:DUF3467 domain-containing protein [Anaerolineae bacterium]RIK23795.1 MAG: DUF3467 domain-containing protein [Anaerolineae bacterium]
MTEPSPDPQPKQTRVTIDLPKDLKPVYSNVAFINYTPAEIVLDFAQVLPRTPRGALMARVIMSPIHAKMLHAALSQNLANFEHQFGEIRLPTARPNIADNFFRFSGESGTDDEGKQDG